MANTAIIITATTLTAMASSSRHLTVAASLLVAAASGLLSVLSLAAVLVAQPAESVIDKLQQGVVVSEADARHAAEVSIGAGHIFEMGRYYTNAALAIGGLKAAERRQGVGGMSEIAIVDAALAVEPASPRNWARRARIQIGRGNLDGARESLKTSLVMGRFVPGLTVPRLGIMLAYLQARPDADMEYSFADQVRIAARSEPWALAAFADGGAAEGFTQRLLSPDFDLYRIYLKELTIHRADKRASAEKVPH